MLLTPTIVLMGKKADIFFLILIFVLLGLEKINMPISELGSLIAFLRSPSEFKGYGLMALLIL